MAGKCERSYLHKRGSDHLYRFGSFHGARRWRSLRSCFFLQTTMQLNFCSFAVDTENGVVTPAIQSISTLPLTELARVRRELTSLARSQKAPARAFAACQFYCHELRMFDVDLFARSSTRDKLRFWQQDRSNSSQWSKTVKFELDGGCGPPSPPIIATIERIGCKVPLGLAS